ncbi:gas vesicle protein [Breznakibacter xylanolyticus]|uniref:Gas vesicle protein n=1 Tax=Breznakibacter xylanolyticus TaxID=990 RepID=A0A2W7N0Z5_9BACT|nr:YtxH domain-containing protein [Breznakibacter xylanolyticus]PZX13808.1 gas vesicle protein [Breznakibacter xylanolyticus]
MNKTGLFIGGMLTGAALGAVAALLMAPKSGKETRDDMLSKLHDLEDELSSIRNKTKEKGMELKDEIRTKINDLEKRIERVISSFKPAETNPL